MVLSTAAAVAAAAGVLPCTTLVPETLDPRYASSQTLLSRLVAWANDERKLLCPCLDLRNYPKDLIPIPYTKIGEPPP